jgi:tetratricopeptide (TPR) repeat protein
MKRILLLISLLLAGLAAGAQVLSPRYEQFKEYRNESDTLRMKQMLDNWGEKDSEFYAAWINYCSVMAVETQDPTWLEMGVSWAKNGRDAFPDNDLLLLKQADALFDNEQFQEALPVLEEIEQRGLGDALTWYHLSTIYGLKADLAQSRHYLEKMLQDGDEDFQAFARELLANYDEMERQADSLLFKPDHAAIKTISQTQAFQNLVDRFAACDTTLTREEVAALYYGSAYARDYESVQTQCENIKTMVEEGQISEAKAALKEKLKDYPVSLYLLVSLFNLSEDEDELMSYAWKARNIITVIDNTGRVYDPEHPFQVICVNDEYIVLDQLFEMSEFKSQALVDGPLDKMTFLNANGLEETVYFQVTQPYWERLNSLFGGND